jgi:transposase
MPPELEHKTKEELAWEVVRLRAENLQLKTESDYFRRMLFGIKSERFVPQQDAANGQMRLEFGGEEVKEEVVELKKEQITYERTKAVKKITPHGRSPLPAHLERKNIYLPPLENTEGMVKIGEDITEVLEIIEAKVYVTCYIRPKFALPKGEGVVQASLPSLPIPKGIAGPSLLAYIIVSKFVDHLPIDRLCKIFARQDVKIAPSTICDWIAQVFHLFKPLYERHCREVIAQPYLQIDETRMQVMDNKSRGKTHRGYDWVVYSPLTKALAVYYFPGRKQEYPVKLLKNFQGNLQSDGYTVYDHFERFKQVTLFSCWAHGRRKFFEAQTNDRKRTQYVLLHIRWLYAIEDFARRLQLTHEERLTLRQEHAKPILEHLKEWLDKEIYKITPQSPTGKAFAYVLKRWDKLCRYTDHGNVEIDNNLVENAIRPIALGRKNYLFAGSEDGAHRGAMFYTFFGTCQKNNINPLEWFKDVLSRIADHPVNQLHALLPQNWIRKDQDSP